MESDSPDWNCDDFLTSTQRSSVNVDSSQPFKKQKVTEPHENPTPVLELSNQDMFNDSIQSQPPTPLETSSKLLCSFSMSPGASSLLESSPPLSKLSPSPMQVRDSPPTPLEASNSDLPPTPLEASNSNLPPTPLEVSNSNLPPTPLEVSNPNLPPTPLEASNSNLPPTPLEASNSNLPPTPLEASNSIFPPSPLEVFASNSSSTHMEYPDLDFSDFLPSHQEIETSCEQEIPLATHPPKPLYQFKGKRNILEGETATVNLSELLTSVTLEEINSLSSDLKCKLAYLIGTSAFDEMRSLASDFHLKTSRNILTLTMTPKEILQTCNTCDVVHSFFEGITKKSPRFNEDDENISLFHNSAFESLLKSINSKTIGIGSLQQNLEAVCASSSTNLTQLNAGGGKGVLKNLPLGDKLTLRTGSGLLVGDNAQRNLIKFDSNLIYVLT